MKRFLQGILKELPFFKFRGLCFSKNRLRAEKKKKNLDFFSPLKDAGRYWIW